MKLKILIGLVGLWLVGMIGATLGYWSQENAMRAKYRRAVELGEEHAPLPTEGIPRLTDACRGKLKPGGPNSIASYVAKMKSLPSLDESYWHVDRTLVGVATVWNMNLSDRFYESTTVSDLDLGSALKEQANPVDWMRHLNWASKGSPEFGEVRYLIVARYDSLTMPTVEGDTFEAGRGAFGAKVLSFPDGAVLCEGGGAVRMSSRVSASGRGDAEAQANAARLVPFVFTESVTRTPLADLCDVGGPELCKLTSEWVSAERDAHGG